MLVGLSLTLSIPTVIADTIQVSYSPWVIEAPKPTLNDLIRNASVKYGVSYTKLYNTLQCESKLNYRAISNTGDYGLAQINLASWPVTKAQAFDPVFSIEFMAQKFSEGGAHYWTCARALGYA